MDDPGDSRDASRHAEDGFRLPEHAYTSRWFRGPPPAAGWFDGFLAKLGALLLAAGLAAAILRALWS